MNEINLTKGTTYELHKYAPKEIGMGTNEGYKMSISKFMFEGRNSHLSHKLYLSPWFCHLYEL